jgi:hypothetical protein
MNKSGWKSAEEIRYSLGDAKKVSVFACTVCANLSYTGGVRGLKFLKGLLNQWGIETVVTSCITVCCAEEIMKQAVKMYSDSISSSDALVVISCAAGVKSAFLCRPDIPVVAVTDSVGSVPVSRQDDPVAHSNCTSCGHCVITFTGGICPLSECASQKKYEPCSRYSEAGVACAVDPSRDCVWKEIERRGDLSALKDLSRIHEDRGEERLSLPERKASPAFLRSISGWMVARAPWFGRFVPFID